jgi:hypothetical protein
MRHIELLKMDLTECFETSAKHNLTPGKYPKEHIQESEHGENLKSDIIQISFFSYVFRHLEKLLRFMKFSSAFLTFSKKWDI